MMLPLGHTKKGTIKLESETSPVEIRCQEISRQSEAAILLKELTTRGILGFRYTVGKRGMYFWNIRYIEGDLE